ncbi:MAG: aminotransferase class V-fold PLP-dependent enzyme [Pseudomonadota bacterium]
MLSSDYFDWSLPADQRLPLEPSVDQWQALSNYIQQMLGEALTNLPDSEVLTHRKPQALAAGEADNMDLAAFLQSIFEPGFNPAHPGFFAYVPGGGLVTSALAEWIIKTLNRYGTAHFASPALGELEYQVIRMFADWLGYPEKAAGVLTTGGSLANFTAVVTARRDMLPENFLDGVLFCSEQTHHSVMKAANLAGFSHKNIHRVATDKAYRLDVNALEAAIIHQRDRGKTPFMVVGSAGTTNTGAIDPLADIAALCKEYNCWFHIDAAYGGAFVITQRGKARFKGISEADSITLDPHKGLFLPYGTGAVLVKDRTKLIEAHEMRGEYMPDLDYSQAHLEPFSLSVELSREHRGLKVALPIMLHGLDAFVTALDEKLDLTELAYARLQAMPEIQVLHTPDLSTLAFRLAGDQGDDRNRLLMETVNAGRKVYLSGTMLNEQFTPRIAILSHRTGAAQIDLFFAELERALKEIR